MRAVVVHPGPGYSVADVNHGLVDGLRANGVDTVGVNFDDYLAFFTGAHIKHGDTYIPALEYETAVRCAAVACIEAACYEFWPDIVVVVSGFFVPPEKYGLLRARGHKVVLWCTESPYEDERQLWMATSADVVILNDPTNLDEFRKHNPNTHYIPHAHNPAIHHPGPAHPGLKSEFCFVGTGYPSRIDLLEKVDYSGLDPVVIAGNWQSVRDDSPLIPFLLSERGECIPNDQTADLYRSTLCSANLYRKEAMRDDHIEGWAMGPREVELAACETFFAREPRGESDELLSMMPTFTTAAELGDIARWAKANPDNAQQAARAAHAAVADRIFSNNVAQLLRHLAP